MWKTFNCQHIIVLWQIVWKHFIPNFPHEQIPSQQLTTLDNNLLINGQNLASCDANREWLLTDKQYRVCQVYHPVLILSPLKVSRNPDPPLEQLWIAPPLNWLAWSSQYDINITRRLVIIISAAPGGPDASSSNWHPHTLKHSIGQELSLNCPQHKTKVINVWSRTYLKQSIISNIFSDWRNSNSTQVKSETLKANPC